jgi:hypothetical protein
MRVNLIRATGLGWFSVALVLLGGGEFCAQAADMKLQAFLLWGTDDRKPPADKPYKPVGPEIREKLKALPLKWTNWFEVNRRDCTVRQTATTDVQMSERCRLKLRRIADAETEVSLIGRGREVVRRKQSLASGEILVLGGNAPNSTAWLVVLKRLE